VSTDPIPITRAIFDDEDLSLILEPLRSGWVVQGRFVREFEERFAAFTGVPHAIAVTSCTTGLQIGAAALGLRPGDEVIVPAFTWISTANIVEHCGATPVFVDIDLHTFNLDVGAAARAITPRTRGIIPVHLFGLSADMDAVTALAGRHGLWVMEDAACGFDTWYKGHHVGGLGTCGVFSFHPRKAITTGEGGMITTHDAALADLCRTLRDHGASRTDLERHEQRHAFLLAEYRHLGFNYRMTDLQGALGVTQMQKADRIQAGRRAGADMYDARLTSLPWLQRPYRHEAYRHGHQSYVTLFAPERPTLDNVERLHERRNAIMTALEAHGISTRQGTHAPPHLHYYREKYGFRPADFPNAYLAERLSLTLPNYAGITAADVTRVIDALQAAFSEHP
jgi:dTDP-4-amino-4,6-dideoxygalactose transaminase